MGKKSKICSVVTGENLTCFLEQLEKAQQVVDVIELRALAEYEKYFV